MAEKPRLFRDGMVRAVLAGRKTQTRSPIRHRDDRWEVDDSPGYMWPYWPCYVYGEPQPIRLPCPFGAPGDVLWVRECWAPIPSLRPSGYFSDPALIGKDYWYRATDCKPTWGGKWHPSIHMPRRACRITLPVVRVWVERVQEITPFDAIAEGCMPSHGSGFDSPELLRAAADIVGGPYPRGIFAKIWNDIYAKAGFGWDANPWVWCCEFKEWKQ